jgi:hypothetical protein
VSAGLAVREGFTGALELEFVGEHLRLCGAPSEPAGGAGLIEMGGGGWVHVHVHGNFTRDRKLREASKVDP